MCDTDIQRTNELAEAAAEFKAACTKIANQQTEIEYATTIRLKLLGRIEALEGEMKETGRIGRLECRTNLLANQTNRISSVDCKVEKLNQSNWWFTVAVVMNILLWLHVGLMYFLSRENVAILYVTVAIWAVAGWFTVATMATFEKWGWTDPPPTGPSSGYH